tara:strand:+ start:1557 stop:2318 length:762 start_codon:yes stop_codon:yes gene_type:complete
MKNAILITGGAKRLGSLIAQELSKEDTIIIIHYNKSEEEANFTKDKIHENGGKVFLIQKTIKCEDDASALIENSLNFVKKINIDQFTLINNASAFIYDDGKDFDEQILDDHMHANFKIPVLLIKSLYGKITTPFLGNVINMLDAKLFGLNPDHYTYTLSKFALLGLTKVAALSYAPKLRVNGIAPGFTLPNPNQSSFDFKRIQELNPIAKGPNSDDLINAVKFLINTGSVTGENIIIDGGAHLSPQKRDATFL